MGRSRLQISELFPKSLSIGALCRRFATYEKTLTCPLTYLETLQFRQKLAVNNCSDLIATTAGDALFLVVTSASQFLMHREMSGSEV